MVNAASCVHARGDQSENSIPLRPRQEYVDLMQRELLNGTDLTPRELSVLEFLRARTPNKVIAINLQIHESTVKVLLNGATKASYCPFHRLIPAFHKAR